MIKKLIFLPLLFTHLVFSQQSGAIVGKITDKEFNYEPLPFATIALKGTDRGTTSDLEGLYSIDNIEIGLYTLEISFVGYKTITILDVKVEANKVTTVNVPIGASASTLDEVIIKTTTRKESEVALLLEQKKAVTQKTSIGAQELSRKGVGNVATAVTKVTGISKEEGSSN
ncbi:MAG: TonB-dependent receptor, partial [Flavobacteriaceae bacterium CG_4_8_14_3_um_filter_34_10]